MKPQTKQNLKIIYSIVPSRNCIVAPQSAGLSGISRSSWRTCMTLNLLLSEVVVTPPLTNLARPWPNVAKEMELPLVLFTNFNWWILNAQKLLLFFVTEHKKETHFSSLRAPFHTRSDIDPAEVAGVFFWSANTSIFVNRFLNSQWLF